MGTKSRNKVDLLTGKITFPIELTKLNGPNNFDSVISIYYSNQFLNKTVTTWNADITTSVVGLGWELAESHIMRLGLREDDDHFILARPKGSSRLVLRDSNPRIEGQYGVYTYITQVYSELKIEHYVASESAINDYWIVTDENGICFTFGNTDDSTEKLISWHSEKGPLLWIGDSIETNGQESFPIIWRLSSKKNIYGQEVKYSYLQSTLNIGHNGEGGAYTVASRLKKIEVINGDCAIFNYQPKNSWEYPAFHTKPNIKHAPDQSKSVTNATQSRIETNYLDSISIYSSGQATQDKLRQTIQLHYDAFLFEHIQKISPELEKDLDKWQMQKRLLTSIEILNAKNLTSMPSYVFTYWDVDKGFDWSNLVSLPLNKLIIDTGDKNRQGLIGSLRTIKTPEGAISSYYYTRADEQEHLSSEWELVRDFYNFGDTTAKDSQWKNPRPYWGSDNFVILCWRNDDNKIRLQVFEWFAGRWIDVTQTKEGKTVTWEWSVSGFDEDDYRIVTGKGGFCLVRMNLDDIDDGDKTNRSAVILYHRAHLKPASWQRAGFEKNVILKSDSFSYEHIDTEKAAHQKSLQAMAENATVAILDRINKKLYIYYWDVTTQAWQRNFSTYETSATVLNAGIAIVANYLAMVTCEIDTKNKNFIVDFELIEYQYTAKKWKTIIEHKEKFSNENYYPSKYTGSKPMYDNIVREVSLAKLNGQIMVHPYIISEERVVDEHNVLGTPVETYGHEVFLKPIGLSWNKSKKIVNLQPLMQDSQQWIFTIGTIKPASFFRTQADIEGAISSLNSLVNCLPKDGNRIVHTVKGGNHTDSTGNNVGWSAQSLPTLMTDAWSFLNLGDTIVSVDGLKKQYTMLEFDAIQNKWHSQNSIHFAKEWDTERLLVIINICTVFLTYLPIPGLDFLLFPLTSILGGIIKAVGGEALAMIASQFIGVGEGYLQSFVESSILKQFYHGHVTSTVGGAYLTLGHRYDDPLTLYYRTWDLKNACYQWKSIQGNFSLPTIKTKKPYAINRQVFELDTCLYGNYFSPISSRVYCGTDVLHSLSFPFDRIVFTRNGRIVSDKSIIRGYGEMPTLKNFEFPIATQFNTPDTSTPPPYLYTPWGGILGFGGEITEILGGTVETVEYEYDLDKAVPNSFVLCFAQADGIQGDIVDYVVNRVETNDGYDNNATYFSYSPVNASYNAGMNSILFNKVEVATALSEKNHFKDAMQSGWEEYYFYNAGLQYAKSPLGDLPEDPLLEIKDETYAAKQYPLALLGKCYCKCWKEPDASGGREVHRESILYRMYSSAYKTSNETFYDAFWTYAIVPSQKTQVATSYDESGQSYKVYKNINYEYNFVPENGSTTQFHLKTTTIETENYNLHDQGKKAVFTMALTYGFQIYPQLAAAHLIRPVVQKVTTRALENEQKPIVIAAKVVTWTTSPHQPLLPKATFQWRGIGLDKAGKVQPGLLNSFDKWYTPPDEKTLEQWLCASQITVANSVGVVIERVNAQLAPYYTLYDKNNRFLISSISNVKADSLAYYCGFEAYEETELWQANFTTTKSYTGKRSIMIQKGTAKLVKSIDLTNTGTTLKPSYMLSLFYQSSNDIELQFTFTNDDHPSEFNVKVTLPTSAQWIYYYVEIPVNDAIKSFSKPGFILTLANKNDSPAYFDNVRFIPRVEVDNNIFVYDEETQLLTAHIDANGLTKRYIYDAKQRLIAELIGKGNTFCTQTIYINYFSREGVKDEFDVTQPNCKFTSKVRGATTLSDDGPVTVKLDTCLYLHDPLVFNSTAVNLPINFQPVLPIYPAQEVISWGFRFQVAPSDAKLENYKGLVLTIGSLLFQFSYLNDQKLYEFELNDGARKSLTNKRGMLAPYDCLILNLKGTFLIFVNGQQIFATAELKPKFGSQKVTIKSQNNESLAIRNVLVFFEPTMQVFTYSDGANKPRQLQHITNDMNNKVSVGISENLYDAQARLVIQTVVATKANALPGFELDFIKNRTLPDDLRDYKLEGVVTQRVDERYHQNPNMAYVGVYYEANGLNRVIQKTGLMKDFMYDKNDALYEWENEKTGTDTTHSIKFGYGIMPKSVLKQLSSLLGIDVTKFQWSSNYNLKRINLYNQTLSLDAYDISGQQVLSLQMGPKEYNLIPQMLSLSVNYRIYQWIYQDSQTSGLRVKKSFPNTHYVDEWLNVYATYDIDAFGRTIRVDHPDTGIKHIYYDDMHRPVFIQDAEDIEQKRICYKQYDALGRLTSISYFATTTPWDGEQLRKILKGEVKVSLTIIISYQYDRFFDNENERDRTCIGYLSRVICNNKPYNDPNNDTTTDYIYDPFGFLSAVNISNGYEQPFSAILGCIYDLTNTLVLRQNELMAPYGKIFYYNQINYAYNLAGQLQHQYTENGELVVKHNYLIDGIVKETSISPATISRSYQYNPLSQVLAINDSFLEQKYGYRDTNNHYISGNINNYEISYTDKFNVVLGDTPKPKVDIYNFNYSYDEFGRLLHSAADYSNQEENWYIPNDQSKLGIGLNGNITNYNFKKEDTIKSIYNYQPGKDLVSMVNVPGSADLHYEYLKNGLVKSTSQIRNIDYDLIHKLPTEISTDNISVNFKYDHLGRRTQKLVHDKHNALLLNKFYVYADISNNPILELVDYGTGWFLKCLFYGPEGCVAYNERDQERNFKNYYVSTDALGSMRAVIQYDQQNQPHIKAYMVNLAYGRISNEYSYLPSKFYNYLFTGQEWDEELQLYNYHARLYDPTIGRFLMPDPANLSVSPYSYVNNNPVNFVDPTGMVLMGPELEIGAAIGEAISGGANLSAEQAKNLFKLSNPGLEGSISDPEMLRAIGTAYPELAEEVSPGLRGGVITRNGAGEEIGRIQRYSAPANDITQPPQIVRDSYGNRILNPGNSEIRRIRMRFSGDSLQDISELVTRTGRGWNGSGEVWHHMADFNPITGEGTVILMPSNMHAGPGLSHIGGSAQARAFYFSDPDALARWGRYLERFFF